MCAALRGVSVFPYAVPFVAAGVGVGVGYCVRVRMGWRCDGASADRGGLPERLARRVVSGISPRPFALGWAAMVAGQTSWGIHVQRPLRVSSTCALNVSVCFPFACFAWIFGVCRGFPLGLRDFERSSA